MGRKTLLLALLIMFMSAAVMAEDLTGGAFPYGLLELRGYPMQMDVEGKFKIYSGATTFVEGVFTIAGNKITFSDHGGLYACRGKRMNPGRYYWALHEQGLQLLLIKDNCGARRSAFLEAPLKTEAMVR